MHRKILFFLAANIFILTGCRSRSNIGIEKLTGVYVFTDDFCTDTLKLLPNQTYYHFYLDKKTSISFNQTGNFYKEFNAGYYLVDYKFDKDKNGGKQIMPYLNFWGKVCIDYNIDGEYKYKKIRSL